MMIVMEEIKAVLKFSCTLKSIVGITTSPTRTLSILRFNKNDNLPMTKSTKTYC